MTTKFHSHSVPSAPQPRTESKPVPEAVPADGTGSLLGAA